MLGPFQTTTVGVSGTSCKIRRIGLYEVIDVIRHVDASVIMPLKIDRLPPERRIRLHLFPLNAFSCCDRRGRRVPRRCGAVAYFKIVSTRGAKRPVRTQTMDAIQYENVCLIRAALRDAGPLTLCVRRSASHSAPTPRGSAPRIHRACRHAPHPRLQPPGARVPRRLRLYRQVVHRTPGALC